MPEAATRFVPGLILVLGCGMLLQARQQETAALRRSLAELPDSMLGFGGHDLTLPPGQVRVAGTTSYLMRSFGSDSVYAFSLYIGYYESQTQGRTIHSPKNCLPGAGWEVISSGTTGVRAPDGTHVVNRYLLGKEGQRAMVYYWYQGRGRVSSNEYRVKWELLRDKALSGRSEEALVRIVVPFWGSVDTESEADSLATAVSARVIPPVFEVLPEYR